MKKQYVKPAMFRETFDICDSIAAGCGIAVGPTRETCGYSDPTLPGVIFITGVGGTCTIVPPGDGDGVCYHIPTAETKLFDS